MRRPLVYLHIALNLFICCPPGMSAPPEWWSSGNPPVIDPAAVPNSRGLANIGQAKWMAKNALEALRAVSPATAEAVENDLVVSDPNAVPPENKPIKTWAAPTTPEEQVAQRAPLLIGQLKAISAPFYHHLNLLNPSWLQNELSLNQTIVPGSHFPWTVETTDDANKAVATIGQLKAVFSLRFETLPVAPRLDTDGDGMPDEWELAYGLNPNDPADAALDPDRDGLDSLTEFQMGTAPLGVYRVTETVLRESVVENGVTLTAPEEFLTAGEDGTVVTRQSAGSGWIHAIQWAATAATRLGPFEFSNDPEPLAWVASDGTLHGMSNGGNPLNTFKHPDLVQPLAPKDWATISGTLSLNSVPTAASPSGEVTLHRDAAGDYHFVHRDGTVSDWDAPPKSSVDLTDISWQVIDDSGNCVTSYMKVNPITSEEEGRILWWGQSQLTEISVPEEWGVSSPPVVQFLDNDGNALVRYETTEPDQSVRIRYSLLDLMSESFSEIQLPETGSTIASVSSASEQIVGNGSSPWFTLADSATLSIGKLRVRNHSGDPEVPMVSIYPAPCEAHHITAEGLVTLTGSNAGNQRVLIRVVANNDADNDGVPDDWEKWWAKQLLATSIEFTPQQMNELQSGNLSSDTDYTGDGMSMIHQFVSLPPVVGSREELNSYWQKPQILVQIRSFHQYSRDSVNPNHDHSSGYGSVGGKYGSVTKNINSFQGPEKYVPMALASQVDAYAPWNSDIAAAGYIADVTTVYGASNLSDPRSTAGGEIEYSASAGQSRFKLIRSFPSRNEFKLSFLRLKRNTNSPDVDYEAISTAYPGVLNNGSEVVDVVDVVIPANRTSSDWVEVKADFIEGKYAQVLYTSVEVVDKDKNLISKLKVGKMSEVGVLNGTGGSAMLNIDKDSDRFFVRIKDGAALGEISIKVSTVDNPDATAFNDNATQIDLVVDGENAISKSMLLVADRVDDEHPVDGVADEASGDRTHRIQLGGSFKIGEIKIGTGTWQQMDTKVPAPFERTVKVKLVNCKYGLIPGFCWESSEIAFFKEVLKERYAQAGIELIFSQGIGVGPWIGISGWLDPGEFPTDVVAGLINIPQETKDIINGGPSIGQDEVAVYLLRCLDAEQPGYFGGVAMPPKYLSASDARYGNKILMGSKWAGYSDHFTGPHELLHILTDAKHGDFPHEFTNSTMIWHVPISDVDTIDATKRISKDQGDKILLNPLAK